jgi:hypothetical protein
MQYTAFGPLSGAPVEVGLICERLTDLPSALGPGGAALPALASVGDGPGGARPATAVSLQGPTTTASPINAIRSAFGLRADHIN